MIKIIYTEACNTSWAKITQDIKNSLEEATEVLYDRQESNRKIDVPTKLYIKYKIKHADKKGLQVQITGDID